MATSTIKQIMNNSDTDYCMMPDGTLIQWGSATVAQGAYTANINFTKTFIDRTKMSIQVTPLASGTDWNVNFAQTTGAGFSLGRTPNTSASTYYWFAIGRWK